jgi:seryl-tRNA synthetase
MTHGIHPDVRPPPADGAVRTRIALRAPIPAALAEEVERRLLFVSPEITGFELAVDDRGVHEVTLFSREPVDHDVLTEKVNYVVDNDVRKQLATPAKAVWTSPERRATHDGIFDLLAETGAVTEVGEGQVALGEPLLSLFAYFDRAVLSLLAEDFTAREYRYPTLIRTTALETAGYFRNFPQHLMFVTRLRNDIDVYRDFGAAHTTTGVDSSVLDLCGNVDYCLPPTMCYHTFQQYSGRTLAADALHVVTSQGKSFRFEAGYSTTLERLWDFTIREIVFLGSREDVLDARERFMRKVFGFVEALGLGGRCEVGNDPFFCGTDTSERIWSQRLMGLKYELRLDVAPDRTIAVGSFNFHDDLFGRAFGIEHGANGPIRSGCVGFGLERLVYAFLCQYGLDRQDWPEPVRRAVDLHPDLRGSR